MSDFPQCDAEHPQHGRCLRDAGHDPGHETVPNVDAPLHGVVCGIDGSLAVRWPRRWMVRELLDDHQDGARCRDAIGLLTPRGGLPRVVACGDPEQIARWAARGDQPTYCCNEVYRDHAEGEYRLSRWSALTLTGKQLADLHLYGYLDGSAMAYTAVRLVLLEEAEEAA